MKETDTLLTTPKSVAWCDTNGHVRFAVAGCITYLIFLKAGTGSYPDIDNKFAVHLTKEWNMKCGWNEAYTGLPQK